MAHTPMPPASQPSEWADQQVPPAGASTHAAVGAAPARREAERPHPLTPLVKGWAGLVALAVGFGRDGIEHPRQLLHGAGWWLLGVVLAYLALTCTWGYFVWRTTRFVVDDTEVRIEHNFVQHTSDRIPFTKIQSVDVRQALAPRLLGLATVRIDAGSGRGKLIEYLPRARAYAMRDYLIARAHGDQVSVDDVTLLPPSDAWNDRAETDEVIVQAHPGRLVLAAVTSHQFLLGSVLPLLVIVVAWVASHAPWGAMVGIAVPFLASGGSVVSHHVIGQWNYALTRTRRGVRVARGLTSLTSESLPIDRVQGLVVRQSLLWRPLGIYRVQMDVLGRTFSKGDSSDVATGSLIVPAGTWADVCLATRTVWPGVELDQLQWQAVSPRGRWLSWFTWGTQKWAWSGPENGDVAGTRGGLLDHRIALVPHARVQSVSMRQGPLDRLVGVARVNLHICAGLVHWQRSLLDPAVARSLAMGELDLCRDARRRRPGPAPDMAQQRDATARARQPLSGPDRA